MAQSSKQEYCTNCDLLLTEIHCRLIRIDKLAKEEQIDDVTKNRWLQNIKTWAVQAQVVA